MLRVGRNREKNLRFPRGWQPSASGTIYFRPTNSGDKAIVRALTGGPLSLRLGATHDEAAENYARLIVTARTKIGAAPDGTVAELCARARLEFLPSLEKEGTREDRERHVNALESLFGKRRYARNVYEASRDTAGTYLRAMDVQRHIMAGRKDRPVGVNREVRTWELVFQWGRAPWGLTEYNPCSGLQMNPESPRRVLPNDEDIFTLYRWLDPPGRFMVALNRFYGRRKVESLGLLLNAEQEDGLHLHKGKDKYAREIVLVWDRRLRRMWARLMRWRAKMSRGGKVSTMAALLNRRGKPYTVSGFNTARTRAMKRAGLKGKFTFHDLRAARASSLPAEKATEVLAHDDARTTKRVYRRGAIIIDLRGFHETPIKNSRKTVGEK